MEKKQIEIELRAEINLNEFNKHNFSLKEESKEKDIYYSYKSDTDRTWIVRIRHRGEKVFLTFKSSKQFGEGAWNEVEINISAKKAVQLNDFLLNNGFFIDVEINKERRTYLVDGMQVNIDEIDGLGTYIEAEIMANEDNIISAKEKIKNFFESLNIQKEKIISKGYVALMRERSYGN